jgi:hypothetical protein
VRQPSLFEPFIVRLERLGLPYFVTGSEWRRILDDA